VYLGRLVQGSLVQFTCCVQGWRQCSLAICRQRSMQTSSAADDPRVAGSMRVFVLHINRVKRATRTVVLITLGRVVAIRPHRMHSNSIDAASSITMLHVLWSACPSLCVEHTVRKVKCAVLHDCRRSAVSPYVVKPLKSVCDAWPVRRQTYGYLPSRRVSPLLGRYQILLLAGRSTCVWTTFPRLSHKSRTAEIRTRDLLSRKSNALTTTPKGHTVKDYRNSLIDRDAVWSADFCVPEKPCRVCIMY